MISQACDCLTLAILYFWIVMMKNFIQFILHICLTEYQMVGLYEGEVFLLLLDVYLCVLVLTRAHDLITRDFEELCCLCEFVGSSYCRKSQVECENCYLCSWPVIYTMSGSSKVKRMQRWCSVHSRLSAVLNIELMFSSLWCSERSKCCLENLLLVFSLAPSFSLFSPPRCSIGVLFTESCVLCWRQVLHARALLFIFFFFFFLSFTLARLLARTIFTNYFSSFHRLLNTSIISQQLLVSSSFTFA